MRKDETKISFQKMVAFSKEFKEKMKDKKNQRKAGIIGGVGLVLLLLGVGYALSKDLQINVLQEEKVVLADSFSGAQIEIAEAKEETAGAKEAIASIEKTAKELEVRLEAETNKVKDIEKEYTNYKKKMEPYEGLQTEEAEVRAAELKKQRDEEAAAKAQEEAEKKAASDQAKAEKQAADEQAKAEEKSRKEAEEARGYETGITYDQLARTPDNFVDQKVKFSGKVIQVMEGDLFTQVRLAVDDNYDTILLCEIPKILTLNNRILEDDYVTFNGLSEGLVSYKSTLGGTITIPAISVDNFTR